MANGVAADVMTSRARASRLLGLVLVAAVTASGPAAAQAPPPPHANGEAALAEGMALYSAGKTHEACEKLAESMRASPLDGTLLNLALCHEKEGKTATAWREFIELAKRGARSRRPEIQQLADQHVAALAPTLPKLMLVVPPGTKIAEVRIDGAKLARAEWGNPMPVDPGPHVVAASERGKPAVEQTVVLARAGAQTITLGNASPERSASASPAIASTPPLAPAPAAAAPASAALPPTLAAAGPPLTVSPPSESPAPSPPAASGTASPPSTGAQSASPPPASLAGAEPASGPVRQPTIGRLSGRRLAGVVAGGVGLAGIALGTAFGLVASSKWSQAQRDCSPTCGPGSPAIAERSNAVTAADLSTGAFIAGAAGLAAGAILYFTAPSFDVAPAGIPGTSAGLVVQGKF
jgi:hypothetical protein